MSFMDVPYVRLSEYGQLKVYNTPSTPLFLNSFFDGNLRQPTFCLVLQRCIMPNSPTFSY